MSGQFVHLMKIKMGRSPQVDVTVKINLLVEVLKYYYDKNDAVAYVKDTSGASNSPSDPKNVIYIAKMIADEDVVSLLIVRGDPDRGLPAFLNPITRKISTVTTNDPGSVRAASAHMVFSTQEIASGSDQGRYRMTFEQSSGIGRVLARDLFGSLLARFAAEFPDRFVAEKKRRTKGEPQQSLSYRPTVRFNPHANASLKEDLENGKIGGFKLVRGRTEFQGEASEPKIEKLDVQLHARIVPTSDFGAVRSLIDHVKQVLIEVDFENLKLELVDEDGEPLPASGQITLDEDSKSDFDMRYCKKLKMKGVATDLPECQSDLDDGIVKFAKSVLKKNSNWS